MRNIDSDLIRGNIDTIILKTMLDGDKYGLDIIKEVEARSNGTYELKQPTLYSCLKRLENQGLISSYWLDSDIGGKRHYYKLTEQGHEFFNKKQEEWAKSKFIIDNLLSNYNYDEYRLVKKDDYDKIIMGRQFDYISTPTNQEPEIIEDVKTQTSETPVNTSENNILLSEEFEDEPIEKFETEDLTEFQDAEITGLEIDEPETLESSTELEPVESENTDEDYEYTNGESDLEEFNNIDSLQNIDEDLESLTDEESQPEEPAKIEVESNEPARKYYVQIDDDEHPVQTEQPFIETPDQTPFENNILSRLRQQENDEINTYVGDQKSYINHLNTITEDESAIQESLLETSNNSVDDEIAETINNFAAAVKSLNNFNYGETEETEDTTEIEEVDDDVENITLDTDEEFSIETLSEVAEDSTLDFEEEIVELDKIEAVSAEANEDNFLQELASLNSTNNHGFFNSYDNPEYEAPVIKKIEDLSKKPVTEYDYSFTEEDSSDAAFDDENFEKMFSPLQTSVSDDFEEENTIDDDTFAKLSDFDDLETATDDLNIQQLNTDFDKIISKNISSYSDPVEQSYTETQTFFTPKFTSGSAKEKLSNLSAYSKITSEEPKRTINQDALDKAKDIDTLKSELEQEGIKFREYKKHSASELAERTYLLSNKINLIKSLILLFGYVFVLSAMFIILNSTSFKEKCLNFSLSYFLYGIIPFAVYAIYHLVIYLISPYKKTPAKFAPRIMLFISIIITVQLLLITYCVNLQLGFYSFTQSHYNHLFWLIPTIVSFAPIFSTVTHMALFYSKNFNV